MRTLLALLCLCSAAHAQQTLRGTVEGIDRAAKRISITNEAMPGGMAAMTMNYSVDNPASLEALQPGDHIAAKIFDGESTLHDLRMIPPPVEPTPSTEPVIRLEALERMALAANPTLTQAQANVRMAAAQARQAGLYPNPSIGYYGDEIRGGYAGGGKQGGFVSQTIVTGGKLGAARKVADLQTREVETSSEAQRLQVLSNVRIAFYQALADQRLVNVHQNLAKLAADAAETSRQLANIGQADRPDILQTEIEQQQTNLSLSVAQHNLQSSWRMLAAVVGKADLAQATLEGDLEAIPDLTYDEALAAAVRDSPQMTLARQAADRAEALHTQARRSLIPNLELYANLSQNNALIHENSPRISGLNGGVQIGVQVPIFNRNQGGIAAAAAAVETAGAEVMRLKLQISRDLAGRFKDYDAARDTVHLYKAEVLPRAQQAYDFYKTNYRNMAAAYPQALTSQRKLFQLELDYVQALESAWQSALMIRGFGLVDGLMGSR